MARLRDFAIVRRYPTGTLIFRQDDECPGVFVVGSGSVRIYKSAPNGKEHVLHIVSSGGTFAEVAAIGGFRCPAFAEALEETECAVLPTADFRRALETDHALCLQLMGSMAMWVKHLIGMMEGIALRDAAGRVSRYLLNQAKDAAGVVRLPSLKKHLASHLNLTSETLSRTLRRLSDMEAIGMDGDEIAVLKPEELESLAEGMGPLI